MEAYRGRGSTLASQRGCTVTISPTQLLGNTCVPEWPPRSHGSTVRPKQKFWPKSATWGLADPVPQGYAWKQHFGSKSENARTHAPKFYLLFHLV